MKVKPGMRNGGRKGTELLLAHCAALAGDRSGASPLERLEEAVGEELAHLLVSALAGDRRPGRFRGADSVCCAPDAAA